MTTQLPTADQVCTCAAMRTHSPRWWTVLAGQIVAAAVYVIAVPLAGVDLAARSGGTTTTVDLGLIMTASLVAGVAAVGWMVVLRRFTEHPDRNWAISAAIVLLISMAGPAGAVGVSAGLTLACMHVGVAAAFAAGSLRLDRARLR